MQWRRRRYKCPNPKIVRGKSINLKFAPFTPFKILSILSMLSWSINYTLC